MATRNVKRAVAGAKGGRKTQSRRGNSSVLSSRSLERNYRNYRDTLLEWSERPAVRYVAGGIGIALLGRFALNISDKYPEISRFFRENLDTIEDKLKEFRGISNQEDLSEARH
ncbi:MAG: hypothetical protein ACJ76H_14090 [Bacteriovoracaceae bacterium]